MTEKSLGVIRIAPLTSGPNGPFFDFPYFDEESFGRILTAIRADGFFNSGKVFIPFHAIGYMIQIPNGAMESLQAQYDTTGATKQ